MVKGEHLILKRFSPDICASEVNFSTTEFWIQVHGLPLNRQSEKNLLKIGSTAGRALETDFVGTGAVLGGGYRHEETRDGDSVPSDPPNWIQSAMDSWNAMIAREEKGVRDEAGVCLKSSVKLLFPC
nr:hypothetical protein CFP56_38066 [Quercus suber]